LLIFKKDYRMKRFLVLFAMVAFVGTMASAQSTKTCTKSKTVNNVASKDELVSVQLPACSTKAAAQLASMEENITAKTCATSGHVSYYQKSVCSTSGKVSLKEVKYNSDSKAFVNVAPPAKKAAALKVSAPAKKAACKKSCAKTCTKSKTAAKSTGTAKQVRLEENK
jgi:hypothetical protein